MKRTLSVLAGIAVLALVFTSCDPIENGAMTAEYTVKHYQQNVYDDGYTLVEADTETVTGITGESTSATAKNYTGFNAPASIAQKTIAADGSTIVEIKYTRKTYAVTYELNGGSWAQDYDPPQTLRYGALPDADKLSYPGFVFAKWTACNDATAAVVTGITDDMTLYAMWMISVSSTYTVKHYQQNVYDDGYTLVEADTETVTGITGESTSATAKNYTGFNAPASIAQKTIAADNSTIVEIKYTRKTYAVTYELNGGSWAQDYDPPQTLRYGALPDADKLSYPGFVFAKWTACNDAAAAAVTGITDDMTLYAIWMISGSSTYTVEHYKHNFTNDTYELVEADTETLTGIPGMLSAAGAKTYGGFVVQTPIHQEIIAADNSTVVKVYYNETSLPSTYIVKHYQQNTDDDGYTLVSADTQTLNGMSSTYTAATAKSYEHFIPPQSITQEIILQDGSTVVNIYYDREIVHYTFDLAGGTTTTVLDSQSRLSGRYGATVQIANPEKDGVLFTGWRDSENNLVSQLTTFTQSTTYTAEYNPLAVGDIVMSDGSYLYPDMYQTYDGNAVPVGVVYHVNSNGVSGYMIGINNKNGYHNKLEWAKSGTTGETTCFTAIECDLINGQYLGDIEGYDNWFRICQADPTGTQDPETNYPAFNYALTYGTNNGLTGTTYEDDWFLPSAMELNIQVLANKATLNASLTAIGGVVISDEDYWSSTQVPTKGQDSMKIFARCGDGESVGAAGKTVQLAVLCVHKFEAE